MELYSGTDIGIHEWLRVIRYNSVYTFYRSHFIVWGCISDNQLKLLFITQKKCIRILFGDCESYIDKFKTCSRVRLLNSQ